MNRQFYQQMIEQLIQHGSMIMLTIIEDQQQQPSFLGERVYLVDGKLIHNESKYAQYWEKQLSHISLEQLPNISILPDGNKVLVERLSRKPSLIICGGGHISLPLVQLAHMLDYEVTVIDDRIEYAHQERFPLANQVICAPFIEGLASCDVHEDCYFVIVTRGHSYDRFCLEQILRKPFGYVGMIGSRRKVGIVMEHLEKNGFSKQLLDRVHTPIGLSIGAQTPQEIAVSIAAELIEVRSKQGRIGSLENSLVEELKEINEPMALATIIDKHGSSPRSIGAKMLIKQDGSIVGSVGGGSAEYEVQQKAQEVMTRKESMIISSAMTNNDAEKDGMVCGGTITVLIEPIVE